MCNKIVHALSLAAERSLFSSVMTGHYETTSFPGPLPPNQGKGPGNEVDYENFSRLDGSSELWVKTTKKATKYKGPGNEVDYENFSRLDGSSELWVKTTKKATKYNYIFNNWKRN